MDNLNKKNDWLNHIDKLIFIFASLYLIGALAWFEKNQQKSKIAVSTNNQTTKMTSDVNRLEENETNRNSLNQEIKATATVNKPTNKVQKLTLNTTIPLPVLENVSNQSTPVQSSTTLSAIPQTNISTQTSLPQPTVQPPNITIPTNQAAQKLTLPPPPSTPTNSSLTEKLTSSPKKVVTPPKLTKVPTLQTLNQNTAPKSQSTQSKTSSSEEVETQNLGVEEEKSSQGYSLIGIVELADNKSFALFNRQNTKMTERVQVGSEIGTSGWVLMSLNGQEVMINRFNESVYLRVGEKF